MKKKETEKGGQKTKSSTPTKKSIKKPVAKSAKTAATRSSRSKSFIQKHRDKKIPLIAMAIFIGLFFISIFMLFRHSNHASDTVILHDVQHLHQIFETINSDCKIIDFEHTQNHIDFLTVEKFVGSEVGAMNLSYPANWKGPYVKDNPTVQEQQYIILKNKSGYYLVPGDGVMLANGKQVGKDIILNEKSDMEALMKDDQALKSAQGALGAKINVGGSYFKKILQTPMRYL